MKMLTRVIAVSLFASLALASCGSSSSGDGSGTSSGLTEACAKVSALVEAEPSAPDLASLAMTIFEIAGDYDALSTADQNSTVGAAISTLTLAYEAAVIEEATTGRGQFHDLLAATERTCSG